MPFLPGNTEARKRRRFEQQLSLILEAGNWSGLREIAQAVVDKAKEGERWACELIRDTYDGRPAQAVAIQDNDGRPLAIGILAIPQSEAGLDTALPVQIEALPSPSVDSSEERH